MNDDTTANPAPLGLMGFGMAAILLSLSNAGFYEPGGAILMMGLLYGGAAQIIAGLMEWKKGSTFGLTAFTSCGFFWVVLIGITLLPRFGLAGPESLQVMGAFLFLWGMFTAYMFVGTLNTNRTMQPVFGSPALRTRPGPSDRCPASARSALPWARSSTRRSAVRSSRCSR